ncbi:FAD-binding protein [Actinotalea sp. M2MS4P-6]|uniref:electron transfer flavoprotein subunit alpha/FixB family protein n=1 Tax=Actinotalea sp. M2MS4P-6 TaxID=2983762 RepID=UPI0021E436E6|nr:FAD-binding protein [Actinotalea sp. M2MS4P-6]MCV2394462.1 FAD-binding protein [Actinotalea sp. M2MS4P-6]
MTEAWIVVHDLDGGNALARSARALAERVVAVSVGAGGLADADLTLTVDAAPGALVEAYAQPVAALLAARGATVVAFAGDVRSRLLAGQVAAHLGVGPTNVAGVVSTAPLVVTRLAYGGLAVATDEITAPVAVLVLEPGAVTPSDVAGQGAVEPVDATPTAGLTLVETRPKGGEQVDLTAAKRVVGVGRGFAAEADLDLARAVANRLGAELACSRPISEGVGWMPAERYLGVSGATIKPDVYLAIGISGQIQHLVGVNHAKVIVAINKDKNAPIFQQADFGVVGDLYQVLPALVDAL